MQMVMQAHLERHEMAREIHAQLQIVPQVESERAPHRVEHARHGIPHLIRDDKRRLLIIPGIEIPEQALARQMDGDIGDLLVGQNDAGACADGIGDAPGNRETRGLPNLGELLALHGHIATFAYPQQSDDDMRDEVAVGDRVDGEAFLGRHVVDAIGNHVEQRTIRLGVDREARRALQLIRALHGEAREAQTLGHLGSDDLDAMMAAPVDGETKLRQALLDLFQIVRYARPGYIKDARQCVDGDVITAREQIVEEIGDAGLGRLGQRRTPLLARLLEYRIKRLLVGDGNGIAPPARKVDRRDALKAAIDRLHMVAHGTNAHAERLGKLSGLDALVLHDVERKSRQLHVHRL